MEYDDQLWDHEALCVKQTQIWWAYLWIDRWKSRCCLEFIVQMGLVTIQQDWLTEGETTTRTVQAIHWNRDRRFFLFRKPIGTCQLHYTESETFSIETSLKQCRTVSFQFHHLWIYPSSSPIVSSIVWTPWTSSFRLGMCTHTCRQSLRRTILTR